MNPLVTIPSGISTQRSTGSSYAWPTNVIRSSSTKRQPSRRMRCSSSWKVGSEPARNRVYESARDDPVGNLHATVDRLLVRLADERDPVVLDQEAAAAQNAVLFFLEGRERTRQEQSL